MPLFRHSEDDPAAVQGADQVGSALAYFDRLSVPERAAEILARITSAVDDDAQAMDQLLAAWLPDTDWMAMSVQQRSAWTALALILREAFQALVLTRMLIRQEQSYKGATWITYVNSPDGLAALGRGDVADVVARRLPD